MNWWNSKSKPQNEIPIQKKTDTLGDTHFIVYYGCVLSRIAYANDNQFFEYYKKIFGPIIPIEFMKQLDAVPHNQLQKYYDDESVFQLKTATTLSLGVEVKTVDHTYTDKQFKGQTKKLIDIIGMQFSANIDALLNEVPSYNKDNYSEFIQKTEPIQQQQDPSERQEIRYMSIATSNYGELFIIADKRTPNTLYLTFRGTYSAKTAGIYTQINTLAPYVLKNKDGFLLGIYKTIIETFHTTLEAMVELSQFLEATQPIKIFTCGHSLGAGLATVFSYIWQHFYVHPGYQDARYKIFSPNIICLSYGSPRVLNKQASETFCRYATTYGPGQPLKIFYERVVSHGDPVAGMPKKSWGFEHPCSTNPELRKEISEDCENAVHGKKFGRISDTEIGTSEPMLCKDESGGFTIALNPQDHTGYLGLSFMKAVNIAAIFNPTNALASNTIEIERENGDTVCRLIMWNGTNYVVVFFNLAKLRNKQSSSFKYREPIEDVKMSPELMSELIKQMKPINSQKQDGTVDLSPTKWIGPTPAGYLYTPTSYREMPQLEVGQIGQMTIGGRKTKRNKKRKKQSRKYSRK
jgi:Lipase (class 3)